MHFNVPLNWDNKQSNGCVFLVCMLTYAWHQAKLWFLSSWCINIKGNFMESLVILLFEADPVTCIDMVWWWSNHANDSFIIMLFWELIQWKWIKFFSAPSSTECTYIIIIAHHLNISFSVIQSYPLIRKIILENLFLCPLHSKYVWSRLVGCVLPCLHPIDSKVI